MALLVALASPGNAPAPEIKMLDRYEVDRAVCRDTYHFDSAKDGAITAAEKLISGKGAWTLAWERYKEVPRSYPGIKKLLE